MSAPHRCARTLVVWCPDWPVVAAIGEETYGDKPVAVFDRGSVHACSAIARAEGVRRGQRRREAQSRCPELVTLDHDPVLAAHSFEPVVRTIEEIAPGVQVIQPGACGLRVRGPARYFGGEEQAASEIRRRLRRLDVPDHGLTVPRIGVADTLFAAEQAARATSIDDPFRIVAPGAAAEFVAPLSVGVLDQPDLANLLVRLGLHTLGQFATLESTDVLARFGPVGAHAHRLAGGGTPRPVTARKPPPEFTLWVDLDDPAERVDQVAFALRATAERFVSTLAAEGLACTTLRIQVVTEDGPGTERGWLHPRWFDGSDIVDRLRWQLQGQGGTDSGLTSRVVRVGLVPEDVDPIGAHADALWGGGPEEQVHRALTRVQSILGHGAVMSAVVGGGRSPADRQTLVPWGDRAVPRRSTAEPWVGAVPTPAPATVYPEPRPAVVLTEERQPLVVDDRGVLNGAPTHFSVTAGGAAGRARLQPVDGWAGPWPVSERWWDAETARRTTRFQVAGADGSAYLLRADPNGTWWAEARYD